MCPVIGQDSDHSKISMMESLRQYDDETDFRVLARQAELATYRLAVFASEEDGVQEIREKAKQAHGLLSEILDHLDEGERKRIP